MDNGAPLEIRETARIVDTDHHVMEMFEPRTTARKSSRCRSSTHAQSHESVGAAASAESATHGDLVANETKTGVCRTAQNML